MLKAFRPEPFLRLSVPFHLIYLEIVMLCGLYIFVGVVCHDLGVIRKVIGAPMLVCVGVACMRILLVFFLSAYQGVLFLQAQPEMLFFCILVLIIQL